MGKHETKQIHGTSVKFEAFYLHHPVPNLVYVGSSVFKVFTVKFTPGKSGYKKPASLMICSSSASSCLSVNDGAETL